jgi:uncharacterized membrane protein YeiH
MHDVDTNIHPMILCKEFYASTAVAGLLSYAGLSCLSLPKGLSEAPAFSAAFSLKAIVKDSNCCSTFQSFNVKYLPNFRSTW